MVIWNGPIADDTWFDFDRFPVPAWSSAGTRYTRWLRCGVPKIPDAALRAVVYLYKSREDAETGKPFGGTGFLVGVQTGISDIRAIYAVTNYHVAVSGGASVVRVSKIDGGVDVFDLDPSEWIFKPGGYDVAITPLALDDKIHEATILSAENMLLKEADVDRLELGPGDDVFMMGRFVDHDGVATNSPAARFGNISIMLQRIEQPTGSGAPSFVIDLHSRTGFSGSPVFVYRNAAMDLRFGDIRERFDYYFLKLLGIHWGQFPERWQIESANAKGVEGVPISGDAQYVRGMSGMTMVVPAWAILELLDMPKVKQRRTQEAHREFAARKDKPIPETAIQAESKDANPDHKEDFMRLLNVAATKKSQDA
jgi:hypothetical protein